MGPYNIINSDGMNIIKNLFQLFYILLSNKFIISTSSFILYEYLKRQTALYLSRFKDLFNIWTFLWNEFRVLVDGILVVIKSKILFRIYLLPYPLGPSRLFEGLEHRFPPSIMYFISLAEAHRNNKQRSKQPILTWPKWSKGWTRM